MKMLSYNKQEVLSPETDVYEWMLQEPQDIVLFVTDELSDRAIEDCLSRFTDRKELAASLSAIELQNHGDYWGVYECGGGVPSVWVYMQRHLNNYGNFSRALRVVRGLLSSD